MRSVSGKNDSHHTTDAKVKQANNDVVAHLDNIGNVIHHNLLSVRYIERHIGDECLRCFCQADIAY